MTLVEKGYGVRVQHIPEWARGWFDEKLAAGLSSETLEAYAWAVRALNIDIVHSTIPEIRHRLAECAERYAHGSMRMLGITVKQVLQASGRKDDAEAIKLAKPSGPRVVVYSQEEIEKILRDCHNIRDRLLIEVLTETGARRGELFNMRIKDVQFDQHSPIVYLHGKTGTRARRLFDAGPDLLAYLSLHPDRNNPEAKFWLRQGGKPMGYHGFYKLVHDLGYSSLKRNIYPHGFRHTAASRDAKRFTDREMMLRHGWSGPEMVGVYAHLSARDVDEKDLYLHGLNSRTCQACHSRITNPVAKFCENCGQSLNQG
jgi:integrase